VALSGFEYRGTKNFPPPQLPCIPVTWERTLQNLQSSSSRIGLEQLKLQVELAYLETISTRNNIPLRFEMRHI
jgi:hypothetical protein